ncbi:MAG: GH3 auxin-responsive promoter family protein [Myxococcales bacterium]
MRAGRPWTFGGCGRTSPTSAAPASPRTSIDRSSNGCCRKPSSSTPTRASEGAFGFGVEGEEGGVLLNCDLYYFELAAVEAPQQAMPLWRGSPGQSYELVVTARNGLWRYRTGDLVRLLSLEPPRIQVLGRAGNTINLSGEKIVEKQVTTAFLQTAACCGLDSDEFLFFGWLAPDRLCYCLSYEERQALGQVDTVRQRFLELLAKENHLFGEVRARARTELHVVRLRPGTLAAVRRDAEARKGASGHAKTMRLTNLHDFCAHISTDQILDQTLVAGIHSVVQSAATA